MQEELIFRKADEKDINNIKKLILSNLESTTVDFSNGFVQNPYSEDNLYNTYILCNATENVIAVCIARNLENSDVDIFNTDLKQDDIKNGKYIYSVCVDKEFRGKKVGHVLYDNLKRLFENYDLYVDIEHFPHNNIASRKFHQNIDFKLIGKCIYKGAEYGFYRLNNNDIIKN